MSRQSKYIYHIENSEDLDFILETYVKILIIFPITNIKNIWF